MSDPRMGRGRDLGFCTISNAETRRFEHREIVGAIPNRKSFPGGEAMRFSQLFERRALGVLAKNGLGDKPFSLPSSPNRSSFARSS